MDVAARYLDWPEQTVRLALREGRATFGIAVKDKALTYKISPGGLVKYKREGVPCFDYETIVHMIRTAVAEHHSKRNERFQDRAFQLMKESENYGSTNRARQARKGVQLPAYRRRVQQAQAVAQRVQLAVVAGAALVLAILVAVSLMKKQLIVTTVYLFFLLALLH